MKGVQLTHSQASNPQIAKLDISLVGHFSEGLDLFVISQGRFPSDSEQNAVSHDGNTIKT
jgi:hypothetical protein